MTISKYALALPIFAALLALPGAAQAQGCGGPGPQGAWCRPSCGGSGLQAPGCPQPPGVYDDRRGYGGNRRYDDERYERRRFARDRDQCWQLSPMGTRVWVCR
jgi:hypothetical protein